MESFDLASFISGFGFGMMAAATMMKKYIKKYKKLRDALLKEEE